MCNCGRNIQQTTHTYTPKVREVVNCDIQESTILSIYNSLVTIKQNNPSNQLNIYLGKVLTMINLADYCKYDIEEINQFIVKYN